MVVKCINDLAGDKQCECFVVCSFANDKCTDIRVIAQVVFYVSDEFYLVEELSEVVPIKEYQALMKLFLNR
jgi:hypothetical protein